MKRIFIASIAVAAVVSMSQTIPPIHTYKPVEPYDNIAVTRIANDTNQTSFIIWIKKEVPLHIHEWHTENIYILGGKGEMTLGDEKFVIKKGDYFNIPEGTPHALKVLSSTPVKVLSIQSPHFDGSDRVLISTP